MAVPTKLAIFDISKYIPLEPLELYLFSSYSKVTYNHEHKCMPYYAEMRIFNLFVQTRHDEKEKKNHVTRRPLKRLIGKDDALVSS